MKKMKSATVLALSFLFLTFQSLVPTNSFLSSAKCQSNPPNLENTDWWADVVLHEGSVYGKAEYIFRKQGKVESQILVMGISGPRRIHDKFSEVGTYKQNGTSVHLEFSYCTVEATITGRVMEGSMSSPGLEKRKWRAERISGENNNSPVAQSGVDEGFSTNSTSTESSPNVVRDSDGKLRPASGYTWVNSEDPKDFRVQLMSGLIKTEDGFRPAKGYRWVNPEDPKDLRVERIP